MSARSSAHVLARALAAGIPPRAEIVEPSEAAYYLDQGVRHFCIGTDLYILHDWLNDRGARLAEILGSDDPASAPAASAYERGGSDVHEPA